MLAYVIRRLLQTVIVLVATAVFAFALARFVGDPVDQMVGVQATPADRTAMRSELGLDLPLTTQFTKFVSRTVRGDFGVSYQFRVPVSTLIAERIPATIELTAISLLLAIMLGVPAGVMAAVRPDTWPSRIAMGVSLTGVSLPTFLIGILMIFTFSATLHWLPAFGRGDVVRIGNWSTGLLTATGLKSIIMPAATLALYQITLIVRLVRSEMISVLRRPHVIAARARGLSARSVYFHHALRSALSPLLPVTAVQIGTVAAFAVVTETVFQWPGLGSLFVKAVQTADVPVMTSYLVFAAAIFATTNLVADLLQMAFDPRACDNVLGRA